MTFYNNKSSLLVWNENVIKSGFEMISLTDLWHNINSVLGPHGQFVVYVCDRGDTQCSNPG